MRQWVAFGIGIVCHGLVLGVLILSGILVPSEIERVTNRPPVYVQILMPTTVRDVPALMQPKPVLKLEAAKLPLPKIQAPLLPAPRPAPDPEAPKVPAQVLPVDLPPMPAPSTQAESKRQLPPVRTGVLGGGAELVTLKLPAREVQTGGFGSPNGMPGDALGGSRGNVRKLGSFNLPSGEGHGNGSGGTHGARGTVVSAGFGPGIASAGEGSSGPGGSRRASVRLTGFDVKPVAETPVAQRRLPEKPSLLPVEILSKPNPVYTEEARRLGVQGEVVLSVVFAASGKLQVLGVVEGLGHGLDEAAWRAAEQIRFKPAERDGKPSDFPATLHVVFQLASQTKPLGEQS